MTAHTLAELRLMADGRDPGRNSHAVVADAADEIEVLRAQRDALAAALRALLADPYMSDPINADRMAGARAALKGVQS